MCTLLQQICGSVEQVGSLRTTFPRASAHACSTFQSGGRTSRRNYTSDCGQRKNHCPKIDAPRFPENKCVQYIPLRQHERIVHARQQVAEDARASPKKNKKHLTSCHNHNCLRSGGGGRIRCGFRIKVSSKRCAYFFCIRVHATGSVCIRCRCGARKMPRCKNGRVGSVGRRDGCCNVPSCM